MKTLLAALALTLLAAAPCSAADYQWPILSVHDGDTITVMMPGWPPELARVGVRLRDIDTPEIGGHAKCDSERLKADQATAFTKAFLKTGQPVFRNPEWDKFSRIDASVIIDGRDLGELLVKAGLARHTSRDVKRQGWCG